MVKDKYIVIYEPRFSLYIRSKNIWSHWRCCLRYEIKEKTALSCHFCLTGGKFVLIYKFSNMIHNVTYYSRLLFVNKKKLCFIDVGRRGKEIGVGLKRVIVELLQKRYSRRKISYMLNTPKSNVIGVCRKFSDTGNQTKRTV